MALIRVNKAGAAGAPVFLDANKYLNSGNTVSSYTTGASFNDNGLIFINVVGKSTIAYTNSTGTATTVVGLKESAASASQQLAHGSSLDISNYDYIKVTGAGSGNCSYTIS